MLTDREIDAAARIIRDAGASCVKTGTGWAGPTTEHHIEIIKNAVGDSIPLKVAGGVRSLDVLLRMRAMGVSRFGIGYKSALRIMEEADVKDIFENPHHPYTRALLASAPSADFKKRWKKPLTLDKDISSSWEETQGCSFYSRCPDRMDHCKNHIPQMRETDTSHSYACFI